MDAMVVLLLLVAGSAVLGWCSMTMAEEEDAVRSILALERGALERWVRGDPSGFLAISAPEVTYFDPSLPHRLNGLDALSRYYEGLRGRVEVDRYELLNPDVALYGDLAILTYDYRSLGQEGEQAWQCSEVYRKLPEGWRIVHTHWSRLGEGPVTVRTK